MIRRSLIWLQLALAAQPKGGDPISRERAFYEHNGRWPTPAELFEIDRKKGTRNA